MKKKIFNLIIVDESGSMCCIERQTVNGINETLQSIRQMQKEQAEAEHVVTLTTFSSNGVRTIYDGTPAPEAADITPDQYSPCGCTPLYDAIGRGIMNLQTKATANDVVIVTIITDGEENSSRYFTHATVTRLIEEQKRHDWVFTFIGANIDAEATSQSLGIDIGIQFDQTDEGTRHMFHDVRNAREHLVSCCMAAPGGSLREKAKEIFKKKK